MTETTVEPSSIQEPKTSSWFSSFSLPPNLTNQLTTLSSSILQATSMVGSAATTFVQKSMPQRPSTPTENAEQTSETVGTNKDFSSMLFLFV